MRLIAISTLASAILFSVSAHAAFQCAGWKLTGNDDGWIRINGEKATSQKVRELGAKGDGANTIWEIGLRPARDGNNYGFEFIKRDGKSWLNVQLIQSSMDAPRIIGSFNCHKAKD
ncbi:hypothetical protein AAY84_07540 [Serratia marcescens]|uniref:hypothetical protein n=1 Tax=Serratia marcescens TaxID=615 RepID=UPI00062C3D12|nr:hypothetical protein [Serratia marcescens]KKZ19032.1 hypothetical protein AAY84_07540 [Serratia marcescens]